MIRVLIVDDSLIARDFLGEVLGQDPDIRVAGFARDGREAIEAVAKLRPDVVTMDITMPRVDGREATREIMHLHPTPIVVVTGNEITSEVKATFDSLELGALAVIPRPPGPTHPDFAEATRHLVATVKLMAEVKVVRRWRPRPPAAAHPVTLPPVAPPPPPRHAPPRVLIIAASTGGPTAIKAVLQPLPPDVPVPIVVIQHIAPGFQSGFAQWLHTVCGRQVHIPASNDSLAPGRIYLPPEGLNLGFSSTGLVQLDRPPTAHGVWPSANHTFTAAARVFRGEVVGVLLSGMGQDGADGLLRLREAGALTLAQDEASCVVYGMPGEAARLDAACLLLPPEQIGATIAEFLRPPSA